MNIFQALLETIFEEYLTHQGASLVTRKNYRMDLRQFLGWLDGAVSPAKRAEIDNHQKLLKAINLELLETYKREQQTDKVPVTTINRRLSAIRAFLKCAVVQGWLTDNPAEGLTNVKEAPAALPPPVPTILPSPTESIPPQPPPPMPMIAEDTTLPFATNKTDTIIVANASDLPMKPKEPFYKKLLHPYALIGFVVLILLSSTLLFSQIAGIRSGSNI